MNRTAEKAIEAYGGKVLWDRARHIQAEVSVHGLAFTLKQRPFFNGATVWMSIDRPFCKLTPIGNNPDISGVLDGHDVYLETSHGEIISKRENARSYFSSVRKFFTWDDLDMSYFANYAFWNYYTLPALLMRDDISWKEIKSGVLEALFPQEIPTHSPEQRFRFDEQSGLLIQHDYTAEIISRYARAANVVLQHAYSNNVAFASERLVTPRALSGKPMGWPTLIAIKVHKFELIE